ncbi:MAG TPA: 5'-nucleotidase C-terminal domain-containing protein, partial [Longimicrobiales bacterium]|nr:5'-nucleotidase C-terminal domain-containing protein [Longimicrobiales bacterium]
TIDISRPVGQRVTELRYEGAPVRDDQSFTLALNNYRQSGGGGYGMIAGAEVVYDRQEDIRELLIEEVRRRGEIRAADYFRQSWRLVPEQAADAALREQVTRDVAPTQASTPAATRKRLRVLSTNDFHGHLELQTPSWAQGRGVGGAAVLTRYFQLEAEAFDGPTIILDGGDVMQGTPVSNLARGRPTVDYFNMARYRGAALGNHEFDWGSPVLRERIAEAGFPWLGANILVTGSDTTPSWVRPTAMIEHGGVRIGLIGLTTEETPETTHAANVAGLTFADGGPIIDRYVPLLRAQGADFVIVVAHAGADCKEDAVTCEGELIDWVASARTKPDLVIGGHTNAIMRTYVNGIALQESANHGWRYGVADLERVSADSVDVWFRGTPAAWADRVTPDSAVAALVARAVEEVGPQLRRVLGTAAEEMTRGHSAVAVGNLIADAQRATTNAQVAIMNNGGVRSAIAPGPVTWGDLYRVHPFGNLLVTLRLRGADLRDAMEHALRTGAPGVFVSGMTVRWDSGRPAGSRVVGLTLADGTAVRDDDVYVVTVNDFLANGIGDGFTAFGRSLEQTPTGVTDLDALIAHVQSLPQPFSAPKEPRFIDVRN